MLTARARSSAMTCPRRHGCAVRRSHRIWRRPAHTGATTRNAPASHNPRATVEKDGQANRGDACGGPWGSAIVLATFISDAPTSAGAEPIGSTALVMGTAMRTGGITAANTGRNSDTPSAAMSRTCRDAARRLRASVAAPRPSAVATVTPTSVETTKALLMARVSSLCERDRSLPSTRRARLHSTGTRRRAPSSSA